eukprot:8256618-Alexandrium_andersonii.AAC.1
MPALCAGSTSLRAGPPVSGRRPKETSTSAETKPGRGRFVCGLAGASASSAWMLDARASSH